MPVASAGAFVVGVRIIFATSCSLQWLVLEPSESSARRFHENRTKVERSAARIEVFVFIRSVRLSSELAQSCATVRTMQVLVWHKFDRGNGGKRKPRMDTNRHE